MKICLQIIVFVILFACCTVNSFAQNSDPRMWSIHFPGTGEFFDVPPGNLTWQNPNNKTMEYVFHDQIVDVSPNIRVHPSNVLQSEVPMSRGLDPNILFGSANAVFPDFFISEGVYVSTDGGNNWFGNDTCLAAPISDHGGDPGPAVGPDGTLYMSYLPGSYFSIKAATSTDYGATWSAGIVLETGEMDKNHTAVDNVPGSPYLGNAYVTWSDFSYVDPPIAVSYSTNNGTTWSTYHQINIPDAGHYSQGCNGAVGPDGVVYIAWQNPIDIGSLTGDYIGLAKSTDGGATWTYNNNIYDCNGIRGFIAFTNAGYIRVNDFPWLAIDNSGGPREGWMYIVTAETNLAPAGNDPDIVMHISTDGGTTWSAGIRVNQDALNNGQYQYMSAVCVGEDGAVNVVYYDTRNATLSNGTPDSAQVYISRSTDGGATFEDFLVSDHSFKPKPIAGLASGYQGDYIGIVEAKGIVYPYWCDDITGIYQAWTTQVTFAPPCGVETASNPYPPNGSVDVDVNLSQLTWSNGAGADTNELYFGTNPTHLTLVQSGSLETSWTIDPSYLPLNYYTSYYWRIVEIGDTCSSGITFNFKTKHDPNFQMVTDTLYPRSIAYWTGTTDGTTKIDTSGVISISLDVGWMTFDISSIPHSATITGITFDGYVNAASWPYWSATPLFDFPVTAGASTIKNDILAGYDQNIAYIYSDEQSSFTTGWHEYPMMHDALNDLQDAVTSSQGWFATGIVDRDFSTIYYISFDGWAQPNPPYIIVDYNYISVPVEMTAFTAESNNGIIILNWHTATETNNKGFELQRSKTRDQPAGGEVSPKSGKSEWQVAGFVEGNGSTTESHSYSFVDKNVNPGEYCYRLKQIDFDGSYTYSKQVEVNANASLTFTLQQNYPNPFNPTTTIKYSIPSDQQVRLNIYNLLGEKVTTLVNGLQKAGQHEVKFNASKFASGVYIFRLEAGSQSSIRKMILMK